MRTKSIFVIVVIGLVVTGGTIVVAAESPGPLLRGSPDLAVHVPNPTVTAGETTELTLQISNDGALTAGAADSRALVTTARNVQVEVDGDGTPISVESGQIALGTITENEPREIQIEITVPEDATPGKYELDVELDYSYTSLYSERAGVVQDQSRSTTESIDIVVDDAPRFAVDTVMTDASVGDTGTMRVDLRNRGEAVARDVALVVESTTSSVSFDGATTEATGIGTVEPGETVTAEFDMDVSAKVTNRSFPFEATVRFTQPDGTRGTHEDIRFAVRPNSKQGFDISTVESTLQVGENGALHGILTNTGPHTTHNVVLQVDDNSPTLQPIESAVAVGTLSPGDSTEFRLPIAVDSGAEPVTRPVDLAVKYQNADNQPRYVTDLDQPAVTVLPEQRFRIVDTGSSLHVGERGDFVGKITNDGPNIAHNVVIQFGDDSPTLQPIESAVAVGTLSPGESSEFRLPIELSREAEAVARSFDFTVKYRTVDDDRGVDERPAVVVDIGQLRDEFELTVTDRELPAGTTQLVTVEVANARDGPVTDVEAKLFATDPLDAPDDEAYIESLVPGESATITFELEADADAVEKTYPVRIDFRYDDEHGNSILSETTRIAFDVVEADSGSLPLGVLGVLLALVAGLGGVAVYKRRRR